MKSNLRNDPPSPIGWERARVRLLLAILALGSLGTAASAESYSVTLAPGWNLVANQLDSPNGNGIRNVLPRVPIGSRVMKFDLIAKAFGSVELFTAAAGWLPGTNILNPGDGLYLSNSLADNFTLTFTGSPHVPKLPLNIGSGMVLVARQTNAPATVPDILGVTPKDATAVYSYTPAAGGDPNDFSSSLYKISVLRAGSWAPAAPTMRIGESVWLTTSGAPPVITGQPKDQAICPGGRALFAVTATGAPPLSYQWLLNGNKVAGATSSTLTLANLSTINLGQYTAVVSNPFGSTTSAPATLAFSTTPPTIVCPSDQTVVATSPAGAPATFTVTASDACDPNVTASCKPASGSVFPVGSTAVLCTATDSSGNRSECRFSVTVTSSDCCDSRAWTAATPAGTVVAGPGVRQAHAMAADSGRSRVVLFGGKGGQGLLGDTWEWDGTAWTPMATTGPSARSLTAMAYDSRIARTVLFGGADAKGPLADTWEWDGVRWTPIKASGPVARSAHAMAYDSARGRTVLFGGIAADGTVLGDTWEFDGQQWIQAPASATGPSPRAGIALAYSSVQKLTVLFGGYAQGTPFDETWSWDGKAWKLTADAGPAARVFPAMTYDSDCNRIVLFGGSTEKLVPMGDTWEWDANGWQSRSSQGPRDRYQHAMAYDTARHQTVLYGGAYQDGALADTWLWGVDRTPIRLLSARAICGGNQVVLAFSGPIVPDSAVNPANYKISCGGVAVAVVQVTVSENGRIVLLTLDATASISSGCSLVIQGLKSPCGGALDQTKLGLECTADRCSKSSAGTEFWLTFPGNYAPDANHPPQPRLFITGSAGTIGAVALPGLTPPFLASFTLPGSGEVTIPLPRDADLGTTTEVIEKKAIHVTASSKVSVYGYNHLHDTTDAYLGLSQPALGNVYLVASYQNVFNAVPELNGAQLAIVGTQDGTTVGVVPSSAVGAHAAGAPFTFKLMKGETYQLRNTNSTPADLTGTIVVADNPIAVFGSHACANLPNTNVFFCNYLVEQMSSVDTWSTAFITVPFSTRTKGDTFRLMALFNGTTVSINGVPLPGLVNQAQFREVQLTAAAQITSDKPILVAQYADSSDYDLVTNSDPFMVLVPPIRLFATDYIIETPTKDFPANYINLMAPSASAGQITIDGSVVPVASFSAVGASGFVTSQVPVATGPHALTSLNGVPFGVIVYGWSEYDAYGYPGGTCVLKDQQTPPRFTCPQPTLTVQVTANCTAPVPDLSSQVGNAALAVLITQNPAAGTLVGPGTYPVTLTILDAFGLAHRCGVTLTVQSDRASGLVCPSNIITNCTAATGTSVTFQPAVCNPNAVVTCKPPSGTLFPAGVTTVTCAGANTQGVVETCSFTVTVNCGTVFGPPVTVSRPQGSALTISWPEGWHFQQAKNLAGPWITVTNFTSPFTIPTTADRAFFRLKQ